MGQWRAGRPDSRVAGQDHGQRRRLRPICCPQCSRISLHRSLPLEVESALSAATSPRSSAGCKTRLPPSVTWEQTLRPLGPQCLLRLEPLVRTPSPTPAWLRRHVIATASSEMNSVPLSPPLPPPCPPTVTRPKHESCSVQL